MQRPWSPRLVDSPDTLVKVPADGSHSRRVRISWVYEGRFNGYFISVDGERVHFTKDDRARDMFIAELTARIHMAGGRTKDDE
jgi:hypothetical protein